MRQRSGPGFATAQTNSAWSLAQRKKTRGSNHPLLEPNPTGLPAGSALIVLHLNEPFDEAIDDALSSLPAGLRAAMSNVEIVVEDEPPDGRQQLGLYRGVPLHAKEQHVP
jgi:hypothetical protein